ncbi:hypothetical protein F5X96DRAFT_352823 [Biscogniauxia mediterranea]|nr:hypothetical protein F5X96DRAFT_352823 [Biscogniauxia mediterranea]
MIVVVMMMMVMMLEVSLHWDSVGSYICIYSLPTILMIVSRATDLARQTLDAYLPRNRAYFLAVCVCMCALVGQGNISFRKAVRERKSAFRVRRPVSDW